MLTFTFIHYVLMTPAIVECNWKIAATAVYHPRNISLRGEASKIVLTKDDCNSSKAQFVADPFYISGMFPDAHSFLRT